MSRDVVWIDETNREARAKRLRLAHVKARQKRIEAAYRPKRRHTLYRAGDRSTVHPVAAWHLYLWGLFTVSLVTITAAMQY